MQTFCEAYVGCHANGKVLGRLANKELRTAKMQVHAALDPLWKNGSMTRRSAYKYLADQLEIPVKKCHVGWFDVEMCNKAIRVLSGSLPEAPEDEDGR